MNFIVSALQAYNASVPVKTLSVELSGATRKASGTPPYRFIMRMR